MRREFSHRRGDSKLEVAQKWFGGGSRDLVVETLKIDGEKTTSDKLTVYLTCRLPKMLSPDKNVEFVQAIFYPVPLDFPNADERKYPVVLGKPSYFDFKLSLTLPEDWRVPIDLPG